MFDFFNSPRHVLSLSNKVLALGLIMLLVGLVGAYGLENQFSLVALVMLHSLVILGPTLLKIGYVMRLLAQSRMGNPQKEIASVRI